MEQRHRAQLEAIEKVIEASLDAIDGTLPRLESLPEREAYEECRKGDYRVAFVRRLWDFFREKWDQRDEGGLSSFLAAADEVIWSCHRTAQVRLGRDDVPVPLAYVAPDFTARAIGRGNPPQTLRASDRLLEQTVGKLPLPLIALPYSCVSSPWWLVLVAHEVGHQVAFAIDEIEEGPRISDFLVAAAREAGASPQLEQRWRAWSHEIFADAFAAAMIGAGQLWALIELEQGSDEAMVRDLVMYPPPIVRHELIAQLLERMGLASAYALPAPPERVVLAELEVSGEAEAWIAELLEMVPDIVTALIETKVTEEVRLGELTDWDAALLGNRVGWWREQFRDGTASPQSELSAARLATVGALAAWAEIADEPCSATRREKVDELRSQVLSVVPASREEGYRDEAEEVVLDVDGLASEVAREVLGLSFDDEPVPAPATG